MIIKPLLFLVIHQGTQAPVHQAMVTQMGNLPGQTVSRFTDDRGRVELPSGKAVRIRKPGFKDQTVELAKLNPSRKIEVSPETDPFALAAAKPANVWLGALDVNSPHPQAKQHFQVQCGFCHQQGNSFTRAERSEEDWKKVIGRMIGYGSRLPTDLQKFLPAALPKAYRDLREHPEKLATPKPWSDLEKVTITEWPLGTAMSQMHDLLVVNQARTPVAYIGDNIQDRVYEVNTLTGETKVHRVPHREGEKNGGLIASRLKAFPQHESTSNVHSLARSNRDGHIFITPSAQRRLIEFVPDTGEFILHEMPEGFYPHTIRVDAKDRVWFTLALSNQVARFDRDTKKFTFYDLPARGLKERLITRNIGALYRIMDLGIPLSQLLKIDWESTGVPLPYGIDFTPDGKVWVARLHTQEIGSIDPDTGKIEMIRSPAIGPRRIRSDANGNLWIVNFGASSISRYSPVSKQFKEFPLPVAPAGSETPYSLNVNRKDGSIWVTGNQSDSLYRFDPSTESWRTIPLPRRTSFTRDIEFDEDGAAYSSLSNFPSWHTEEAQPTLVRVQL